MRGLRIIAQGRTAPRARQLFAALALLIFTVQNYVLQTHVHPPAAMTAAAMGGTRTPASWRKPAKANPLDDPATCPLCQVLALAGHYTTPGAILLLAPFVDLVAKLICRNEDRRPSRGRPAFYGRAPPRA
jgi:hypothetical protein